MTAQERTLAALRTDILSGTLPPGTQLVQESIADRYAVSRVPVREALQLLTSEGLVQHSPNRGYFVTELSVTDLHEVYALRRILETHAIAAAVPALLTELPYTVESLTDELLALVASRPSDELLPPGMGAWLLVETGGDTAAVRGWITDNLDRVDPDLVVVDDTRRSDYRHTAGARVSREVEAGETRPSAPPPLGGGAEEPHVLRSVDDREKNAAQRKRNASRPIGESRLIRIALRFGPMETRPHPLRQAMLVSSLPFGAAAGGPT